MCLSHLGRGLFELTLSRVHSGQMCSNDLTYIQKRIGKHLVSIVAQAEIDEEHFVQQKSHFHPRGVNPAKLNVI